MASEIIENIKLHKEIAIIGPTASGKTDFAIELAKQTNSVILSCDSLSVYKTIDIASAKPSKKDRDGICHFCIDVVSPDESFSAVDFVKHYKKAKHYAIQNHKNLIIVGGTGFYLKAITDGLSPLPPITKRVEKKILKSMQDPKECYLFLSNIDKKYMTKISPNDNYRIRKAISIYHLTGATASSYFEKFTQKPLNQNLPIYQIDTPTNKLFDNIQLRTDKMLKDGLIDEVISLENSYQRDIQPMSAIGIKESICYIDGKIQMQELRDLICQNTKKLVKYQKTFFKGQFKNTKLINKQAHLTTEK